MLSDEVGDVRQRAYEALIKIGAPCVLDVVPLLIEEEDDLGNPQRKFCEKSGNLPWNLWPRL